MISRTVRLVPTAEGQYPKAGDTVYLVRVVRSGEHNPAWTAQAGIPLTSPGWQPCEHGWLGGWSDAGQVRNSYAEGAATVIQVTGIDTAVVASGPEVDQ